MWNIQCAVHTSDPSVLIMSFCVIVLRHAGSGSNWFSELVRSPATTSDSKGTLVLPVSRPELQHYKVHSFQYCMQYNTPLSHT